MFTVNKLISSKHIRKFSSFFVGTAFSIVISYLTTYLVNQNLTPEELGKYSYVFTICNLLFPFLSLSVYCSYLRFDSLYDKQRLKQFVIVSSVFSTILMFTVIYIIFGKISYCFFSFIIVFSERLYFFRTKEKILIYNIVNNSQKLILLLLVYYYIADLTSGLLMLYTGFSYMLISLLSWLMHKKIDELNVNENVFSFNTVLKFSIATSLMTIVAWFSAVSDQVIIEYYFDYASLAPYSVAFRMISMLTLISGIFIAYYPLLYYKEMDAKNGSVIKNFQNIFVLLLVVFAISICIFRDEIYTLFGATQYIEHSQYLILLVAGEVFRLIASIMMTYRTYKLQQNYILTCLVVISIFNLLLNMLLIPVYGPIAAAWTTLLTYILYTIISFFISFRHERNYLLT